MTMSFAINPAPARAGLCPRCAAELETIRLHFPGWRFGIEGTCPTCGHAYLQDLPSGHALVYPTAIDLDTGETFQRGYGRWFADRLRATFEHPDAGPIGLDIPGAERPAGPTLLLNCLDPIYGHSLLRLLNIQTMIAEGRRCIVLVPRALRVLVPADLADVWTVDASPARCGGWLLDLDRQLHEAIEAVGEVRLFPAVPHPNATDFDLEAILPSRPARRTGDPSIAVSLRPDRTWGIDTADEAVRLQRLVDLTRASAPGAGFTLMGIGDPGGVAGAEDLRSPDPDDETELAWMDVLRGADMAIGVHGSNMLLPSGLAATTLELMPEPRYSNAFQATLVSSEGPMEALVRHRTLYGSATLEDLAPERVAAVALATLGEHRRAALLLSGRATGIDEPWAPLAEDAPADGGPIDPGERSLRERAALRTRAAHTRQAARQLGHRVRARSARLPIVRADRDGNLYELLYAEEVEAFTAYSGHFEAAELQLVGRYLEPGMTAIDVGANIGAFSVTMARAVGPSGTVHAFEPEPASRERLMRNLGLNELANVTIFDEAVSGEPGEAAFFQYAGIDASWSGLYPREVELEDVTIRPAETLAVRTTTIDEHCADASIGHVDVLKVDTEGADLAVLRGAGGLLGDGAIDMVVVEACDHTLVPMGETGRGLVAFLEGVGMATYELAGDSLVPRRIVGPQMSMLNIVALSPGATRRARTLGVLD